MGEQSLDALTRTQLRRMNRARRKSHESNEGHCPSSDDSVDNEAEMHHESDSSYSDDDGAQSIQRVLIVDDNRMTQMCIKKVLRQLVSTTETLSSGEEFLEYAMSDLLGECYNLVI